MTAPPIEATSARGGRVGHVLAYLALLAGGVGAFLLIRSAGEGVAAPDAPVTVGTAATAAAATAAAAARTPPVDVVLHVTATLAAVIALGFALGRACRYVGQPPVIGEVLAGIVLGPSVLGAAWPAAMHALVPAAAADPGGHVPVALKTIAELGVILYMFLVGLELNGAQLRGRAGAAVAVSHASIVVPFVLGAGLALWLYPILSHRGVPFTAFALFLGVAMSVTAFPVLARILTDQGLERTPLGVLALGCAAADDATAWCLLAVVVGVTRARVGGAVAVVVGAAAFVAVMLVLVRPVVRNLARRIEAAPGPLSRGTVAGTFVLVLASAWVTEAIGIHAIFGAFVLGALVPHDGRVAREFSTRLKDLATALLLPAFFAFTGMRTQIGLVSGPEQWLLCGAVIVTATVGKFGGTLLAARLAGHPWRESAALGTLMNTRGLMELIVLNVGLDLGVIGPTLFTMMVIMALATTIATAPALRALLGGPAARSSAEESGSSPGAPNPA